MTIHPAKIVAIPFPYSDMSTRKRRPVLVLTSPDERGDFIGLAITSVVTGKNTVCLQTGSMKTGELPKTCWVRYDKIFTLSASLIKKQYGTLQNELFIEIIDNSLKVNSRVNSLSPNNDNKRSLTPLEVYYEKKTFSHNY